MGGEQQHAAALAQFLAYLRSGGNQGGCCSGVNWVANNNITPCSTGGTCSGGNGGGGSGGATKSGKALTTYKNQRVNVGGDSYSVANKGNVALAQPLLETTPTSLLSVSGGGSMTAVTTFFQDLQGTLTLTGNALSVSGNSSLSGTGALLSFVGIGNTVTITNSLCAGACALIAGIPVFITGGAPVSLTNPIKNAAGNTITYSSPSAARLP